MPPATFAASNHPKASLVLTPKAGITSTHPRGRGLPQREQKVAALQSECGAPLEKIWDVGAQRRGFAAHFRIADAPSLREDAQRRRRVAAAAAQSRLHRNALAEMDGEPARRPTASRGSPHPSRRASHEVRFVCGARRIVARELERPAHRTNRQRVVERDRLKDRPQLVVAVGARAKHAQRSVNFRERPDAHVGAPSRVIGLADRGTSTLNTSSPSGTFVSTCDKASVTSNAAAASRSPATLVTRIERGRPLSGSR